VLLREEVLQEEVMQAARAARHALLVQEKEVLQFVLQFVLRSS
jgi:hypothetical protein